MACALLAFSFVLASIPATASRAGVTLIVSSKNAASGNGNSRSPSVSDDGRYVAFASRATNLVPGDTNHAQDIFVRDMQSGAVTRVSVSSNGGQVHGDSSAPVISGDGKTVAYRSVAQDLVTGSITSAQVYVTHLDASLAVVSTALVSARDGSSSVGDGDSGEPSISSDGRFVAFTSAATNLISRPDDNGPSLDVFVRDLQTNATARESENGAGQNPNDGESDEPSISAHGRYVAFRTTAQNFFNSAGELPDTNGVADVEIRDRDPNNDGTYDVAGSVSLIRASVGPGGRLANGASEQPSIKRDETPPLEVSFASAADDLVYAGDLPVALPDGAPFDSLKLDTNGVEDVFLRNVTQSLTSLISLTPLGSSPGDGPSYSPVLSADGSTVAFTSEAGNLVGPLEDETNDQNFEPDVYARSLGGQYTTRISEETGGKPSDQGYANLVGGMSGDGRFIAFSSGYKFTGGSTTCGTANCSQVFLRDARTCAGVTPGGPLSGPIANGIALPSPAPTVRLDQGPAGPLVQDENCDLVVGTLHE